jgi:diaminopropionate ammonia-lyase
MTPHQRPRVLYNQKSKSRANLEPSSTSRMPSAFHQRLNGYAPTPLIRAPDLARMLGVGQVLLKDESIRLGLPAFKILGASWAIYRALESRVGTALEPWGTLDDLAQRLAPLKPITLAAATDGNHGRAVAHMASLLGFASRIYVPAGTARARIDAIASEGASVEIVDGTYDDAVARSAQEANERCLVISDTSWPEYQDVARWVMEGYSTIFSEVDNELASLNEPDPDVVVVQIGVGALAAAVVSHYRQPGRDPNLSILGVEPVRAACMQASIEAGEVVSVPGPHDSIMAGLNCGRPSMLAWPIVSAGINAFISIDDDRAREAIRALARTGIVAGETGAAGLGGLLELLTGPESAQHRKELQINDSSRVLLFITEGATDPQAFADIVG